MKKGHQNLFEKRTLCEAQEPIRKTRWVQKKIQRVFNGTRFRLEFVEPENLCTLPPVPVWFESPDTVFAGTEEKDWCNAFRRWHEEKQHAYVRCNNRCLDYMTAFYVYDPNDALVAVLLEARAPLFLSKNKRTGFWNDEQLEATELDPSSNCISGVQDMEIWFSSPDNRHVDSGKGSLCRQFWAWLQARDERLPPYNGNIGSSEILVAAISKPGRAQPFALLFQQRPPEIMIPFARSLACLGLLQRLWQFGKQWRYNFQSRLVNIDTRKEDWEIDGKCLVLRQEKDALSIEQLLFLRSWRNCLQLFGRYAAFYLTLAQRFLLELNFTQLKLIDVSSSKFLHKRQKKEKEVDLLGFLFLERGFSLYNQYDFAFDMGGLDWLTANNELLRRLWEFRKENHERIVEAIRRLETETVDGFQAFHAVENEMRKAVWRVGGPIVACKHVPGLKLITFSNEEYPPFFVVDIKFRVFRAATDRMNMYSRSHGTAARKCWNPRQLHQGLFRSATKPWLSG